MEDRRRGVTQYPLGKSFVFRPEHRGRQSESGAEYHRLVPDERNQVVENPGANRSGANSPCQIAAFNNSLASAMPGAGRPYSLAVTRASATNCRQRYAARMAVNSSV